MTAPFREAAAVGKVARAAAAAPAIALGRLPVRQESRDRGAAVLVLLASLVLTIVLTIVFGRLFTMAASAFRLPVSDASWLPAQPVLAGLFSFYLAAVIFPAILFIGWRHLAGAVRHTGIYGQTPPPLVSIIIPAFNEEKTIRQAIDAALAQDYPSIEVIVVDDGSRDRTRYIVESSAVRQVIHRTNRGKAAALNTATEQARGTIIVFTDSDSFLASDAVSRLVPHFYDRAVGAVAGRVAPIGRRNLISAFQVAEYLYGQEIMKRAQIGSGCPIAVLPGPILAVRRQVIREIGGFSNRTLTEDFDATLEIVNSGYDVRYEGSAVARTIGAETWQELYRQRLRWSRGTLQVLQRHKAMVFSTRWKLFGSFWLPYYLVSGFGTLVLDLAVMLLTPVLALTSGAPVPLLAMSLASILAIEGISALGYCGGLVATGRCPPRLLVIAFLSKPFATFLSAVRALALYRELRAKEAKW